MALSDEQKEDLQFWFYSAHFLEGKEVAWALGQAAVKTGITEPEALAYLENDGRIKKGPTGLELVTYDRDSDDPRGIYVDIEWMTNLLRPKLKGTALYRALGIIFKLSMETARLEESQIRQEEGED